MGTKKWYTSKTMLAGILTILITAYMGLDTLLNAEAIGNLPDIPVIAFTILGALGLYGRTKANTRIE